VSGVLPDFDVLGVSLKTFGIFFALNFVAWGAVAARRLKELGRPEEWAYEMVLVAVAGGIVGAKLYYVIQHGAEFSFSGLVSGSGLVWYGGLFGGVALMLVWAQWRGFRNLHLCDIAGICIPLGYAIGRIGCQVSGDGDYGTASGLPWAMAYPDGTIPTTTEVHPTPIYETFAMGLVALGLWHLRDRVRPGIIFALYLVVAGLERFLIEFIRRNEEVLAGLTQPQLIALAMIAAGGLWLWLRGGFAPAAERAPPPRRAARQRA
jgi:phosphatidylglycerol---prolipoprotein diacylglyceryl transferase